MLTASIMRVMRTNTRRPDDSGSKRLWHVGQFLPDYTADHPRRQSSGVNLYSYLEDLRDLVLATTGLKQSDANINRFNLLALTSVRVTTFARRAIERRLHPSGERLAGFWSPVQVQRWGGTCSACTCEGPKVVHTGTQWSGKGDGHMVHAKSGGSMYGWMDWWICFGVRRLVSQWSVEWLWYEGRFCTGIVALGM
jgi:hypothetical protein